MPHVSDVRPTSHDRHDPMLVAALAAGNLAGIDRDQAVALTSSCADCANLHEDLLALARATAAAPPPFAAPRRDFRLTPADAARLRPTGWRRLVAALSAPRSVATRPLGVGLATLGLVGLLVGNVQLGGTTASLNAGAGGLPTDVRAAATAPSTLTNGAGADTGGAPSVSVPAAQGPENGLASGAPVAPLPAASAAASGTYAAAIASGGPRVPFGGATPLASDGKTAVGQAADGGSGPLAAASPPGSPAPGEPFRPLNVLFGAAIVVGLGLLVVSRFAGRRSA
jgi:hypothetical protein